MSISRVSVIICTHNPRPELIARALRGLNSQTYPKDAWELIIVDNQSSKALAETLDLSWHPNARVERESKLGLTFARLRAIREARYDLLIFVDDDNVLGSDYIERATSIGASHPFLGAWGGSTIGEFEVDVPNDVRPYLTSVGVREITTDVWSNRAGEFSTTPIGAGMIVRRAVAETYAQKVYQEPLRQTLDRAGAGLMGGGDRDLADTSCEMGLGRGLFACLRLIHIIPRNRLEIGYLARLRLGSTCSAVLLNYLRGIEPPARPAKLPWKRRLLENYLKRHIPPHEVIMTDAYESGVEMARQIIADHRAGAADEHSHSRLAKR